MSSRRSTSADIRAARGWLLAVSSTILTLTGHTVADGAMPDPSLALAIAALFGWASTTLADRHRPLGILVTLASAQLAIHFSLTLLGTHPPHTAAPFSEGAMLGAHAVATVVMAALLVSAERGLVAVASALRRLLPVVCSPAPHPALRPLPIVDRAVSGHPAVVHPRLNALRGPPHCS